MYVFQKRVNKYRMWVKILFQGIEEYLKPVEETIQHYLIPSITGGHICTDNERRLTLSTTYGYVNHLYLIQYSNNKKLA